MKRNETILVYSVTGLLVVILGVAIAFGDGGVQASTSGGLKTGGLKTLAELQDAGPASADGGGALEGAGAGRAMPTDGPAPTNGGTSPSVGDGSVTPVLPVVDPGAEAALNVGAAPPAATDAATRALVLLGESSRDRAYRVVSVRHGDTFSQIVQRWCGSLDQMDVAASLNEEFDLGRLEPGTRLYLPWVDDEVLLTALERRKTGAVPAGNATPGRVPAGQGSTGQGSTGQGSTRNASLGGGEEYKVKSGDMLWNIAVARVGASKANKFIEAVRDLNPDLRADPNRLVAGKTILLPR